MCITIKQNDKIFTSNSFQTLKYIFFPFKSFTENQIYQGNLTTFLIIKVNGAFFLFYNLWHYYNYQEIS